MNYKNQTVGVSKNRRQKRHFKLIDLDLTQSSALSTQSSNPSFQNFEQVCTELLRDGHRVKFKAPGNSMYPTICDGDLITVQPIKPSDVIVSDIILYRHEYGVVAHRVVGIKKPQFSDFSPQNCFTLRGDAAVTFDDPVGANQILGKVTIVEREGRRIDPYSFGAKICFKARRLAARLKRFILFQS